MPESLLPKFRRFAPFYGTPYSDKDDSIVIAPYNANPKDVIAILNSHVDEEKDHVTPCFKAVIIPPKNREHFIKAANALSKSEKTAIEDALDVHAYSRDNKDFKNISNFLQEQIKRAKPFVKAAEKLSKIDYFSQVFTASIGETSSFPKLHTDPDITIHISAQGAPLQFALGNNQEEESVFDLQQGDMAIFNKSFQHRSSHKAKDIGQFSLAFYSI